ncbi:hypothetical protein ANN_26897 [Periplaneta americana]|uniref:Uncharacterized protein n=1 Tax=Periplaneta americana TaxID=6978 RepID=A0ABQ8RWI3_PERAM|nr:hypothetical protein ANN_26897 [Periplaneta americana]
MTKLSASVDQEELGKSLWGLSGYSSANWDLALSGAEAGWSSSQFDMAVNPGLAAIWEDEKQRLREEGRTSQLTPQASQDRLFVTSTESELFFKHRLHEILLNTNSQVSDNSSSNNPESASTPYPAETPKDSGLLEASFLDLHVQTRGLRSSTGCQHIKPDDDISVVDEYLVLSLPSSQRVRTLSRDESVLYLCTLQQFCPACVAGFRRGVIKLNFKGYSLSPNSKPLCTPFQKASSSYIFGMCYHSSQKPDGAIEKTAIDWNPQGVRKRGRPRKTWKRSIEEEVERCGKSWKEVKRLAGDRVRWRNLTAALCST